MEEKNPMLWIFAVVVALVLGAAGGYWYGNRSGYTKGQAEAQVRSLKSATEAANPFKQSPTNPLQSIKLNPFK